MDPLKYSKMINLNQIELILPANESKQTGDQGLHNFISYVASTKVPSSICQDYAADLVNLQQITIKDKNQKNYCHLSKVKTDKEKIRKESSLERMKMCKKVPKIAKELWTNLMENPITKSSLKTTPFK